MRISTRGMSVLPSGYTAHLILDAPADYYVTRYCARVDIHSKHLNSHQYRQAARLVCQGKGIEFVWCGDNFSGIQTNIPLPSRRSTASKGLTPGGALMI